MTLTLYYNNQFILGQVLDNVLCTIICNMDMLTCAFVTTNTMIQKLKIIDHTVIKYTFTLPIGLDVILVIIVVSISKLSFVYMFLNYTNYQSLGQKLYGTP